MRLSKQTFAMWKLGHVTDPLAIDGDWQCPCCDALCATRDESRKHAEKCFDFTRLDSWTIAERLGIKFVGDANCIQHGGLFFSTANWHDYGYSDCVEFAVIENRLIVSLGTVNRIDEYFQNALDCCGVKDAETAEQQIEIFYSYCGMETTEDFAGRYESTFDLDEVDEADIWYSVLAWLQCLSNLQRLT